MSVATTAGTAYGMKTSRRMPFDPLARPLSSARAKKSARPSMIGTWTMKNSAHAAEAGEEGRVGQRPQRSCRSPAKTSPPMSLLSKRLR